MTCAKRKLRHKALGYLVKIEQYVRVKSSAKFRLYIIKGGQAVFIKLVFTKNELNGVNTDVPTRFYLRAKRFNN